MSTDIHFEDVERGDDTTELEPLNSLVLNPNTGTAQYNNDTKTNDNNTMNSNISASLATSNKGNDDDVIITSLLQAMGFNSDGPIYESTDSHNRTLYRDYETPSLAILSQTSFSSQETPSPGRLNQCVDWWRSPLHAASYRGLQEVVAKLLEPEYGADLHLQDSEGNTAAFIALKEGHVELAKYFVEKGSTLNTINPLAWAILTCKDKHAALDILSTNSPTPDQLNKCVDWCFSPIHAAAYNYRGGGYVGHFCSSEQVADGARISYLWARIPGYRGGDTVVDKLLECEADPELQDKEGNTPADVVLKTDRNCQVQEMIKEKSTLNTINNLKWAIEKNNTDTVLDILSRKAWCSPAIHDAAYSYRGGDKVVDKLLECGADPELQDKEGNTPADVVLKTGRNCQVQEMIKEKSTLNTINCLQWAIEKNDTDTALDILSRKSFTCDQLNNKSQLLLHFAVHHNMPKVVDKLIKAGADPKLLSKANNSTAADRAISCENYSLAEHLIKNGSFFNKKEHKYCEYMLQLLQHIQNNDEASALMWLSKNYPTISKNQQNVEMWLFPFHKAVRRGLDKIVDKLVEFGDILDLQHTTEYSEADYAVTFEHFKIAVSLIKKGSHLIEEEKFEPLLPLMKYIEENDEDSAVTMLSKDPPICTAEQLNIHAKLPPLHFATLGCQEKVIYKLLDCGAEPQSKDMLGRTAADVAMNVGNYKLAKSLLEKGSTLLEKNKKMEPILSLMECIEDGDEISALDKLETNPPDKEQLNIQVEWPPLHFASKNGMAKLVKKMLDFGADQSLKKDPFCGDNALEVAIKSNQPKIVELLISHENANNKLPWSCETYLNHAVVYGFDEIMVKLINKGADITNLPPNAKIPSSVMRKCLDSSISWVKEEKKHHKRERDKNKKKKEERKLQYDYQLIMKIDKKQLETEKIKVFYSSLNSSDLLVHPLIKTLLFKKWKRIEWVFWFWILIKFSFFLSLFIIAIFIGPNNNPGNKTNKLFHEHSSIVSEFNSSDYLEINSGNKTNNFFHENSSIVSEFNSSNYSEIYLGYNSTSNKKCSNTNKNCSLQEGSIMILFSLYTAIFLITELFQAMKALYNKWKMHIAKIPSTPSYYSTELKDAWKVPFYFTNKKKSIKTPAYFTDMKNYIQWSIIICLSIILVGDLENSQRQSIFGVLLPLSCLEFLHQIGHIPGCAHIIKIFNMVLWTFITYLAFYGLLIISFAASFYVILPPPDDPENYPFSFGKLLAKYIVMFTGEQEFMEVPFPKEQNWFEIVLFVIFLILVPIVLMNVLNALAVRDIQEMMKEVEIPMLEQLLDKVHLFETILHTLEKYDCFRIVPNLRLFDQESNTNTLVFHPFKENIETGFSGFLKRYVFSENMTQLFLNTYQVIEKECIHGPNGALAILSLKQDEEGSENGRKLNDDLVRRMNLQMEQIHLDLKEGNNKAENSNDDTSQDEEGNEIGDDLFKQMIKDTKNLNKDQMKKIVDQIMEMLTTNQGSQPSNQTEAPVIDG